MNGDRERLECILRLVEFLVEDADRGLPIIVEGRRDEEALRRLGVRGRFILSKNYGRALVDVVEDVRGMGREAIILMDFDRRGREYAKSIAENLEAVGITPNLYYWRELSALAGRWVKDVEGLPSYIETLKRRVGCY